MIKRSRRIYYNDNGIRNAVLSDFRPLQLRDDIGKLWENYVVSEFHKRKANHALYHRSYFWRNRNGAKVDYLELADNHLKAYEIKYDITHYYYSLKIGTQIVLLFTRISRIRTKG